MFTTDFTPNHTTSTTTGVDHSPFITDAARKDASIDQGHTPDLNVAEVQATTRGTHPTPHPTTTSAHDTHPLKNTLGNTLSRPHCTDTAATQL